LFFAQEILDQNRSVCWSIAFKVKSTVASQFFGAIPFDRIPKVTKAVNVHSFIHIFTFSDELVWSNALEVKKNSFTPIDLKFLASR
jgi:hypothetical protein